MQSGWTALFIAVQFHQTKVCKELLESNAKVDDQNNEVRVCLCISFIYLADDITVHVHVLYYIDALVTPSCGKSKWLYRHCGSID